MKQYIITESINYDARQRSILRERQKEEGHRERKFGEGANLKRRERYTGNADQRHEVKYHTVNQTDYLAQMRENDNRKDDV